MACGEMTEAEFATFLTTTFEYLAAHSADGSVHYVFMDWRHMQEMLTAGRAVYSELKNLCVWNRPMAEWERSTARNTSSYLCGNRERPLTSITSSWANTAVTVPTYGIMRE